MTILLLIHWIMIEYSYTHIRIFGTYKLIHSLEFLKHSQKFLEFRTCCDCEIISIHAGKGVCLTHYNLVSNILQIGVELEPLTAEDVIIAVLPFFHIYGLTVLCNKALYEGQSSDHGKIRFGNIP